MIARIDAAGGMYLAAEAGLPQTIMGQSAIAHQDRIENGEETVVGVNKYCLEGAAEPVTAERPQAEAMAAYIADFQRFKDDRDGAAVDRALDDLARAAAAAPGTAGRNTFAKAVAAAEAGVTHGEICACLRRELGVGQPLVVA